MVRFTTGEWLTVVEAAELLGTARQRVHIFFKDGRLTPVRVGFQYLLQRRDVEAFARKMRKPGRSLKTPALQKASAKK
jgi:excisionase family DNA binding protein